MTLDEAIACEEKIVDGYEKIKKVKAITEFELFSANNHGQILEWLKELKQLREVKDIQNGKSFHNGFVISLHKFTGCSIVECHKALNLALQYLKLRHPVGDNIKGTSEHEYELVPKDYVLKSEQWLKELTAYKLLTNKQEEAGMSEIKDDKYDEFGFFNPFSTKYEEKSEDVELIKKIGFEMTREEAKEILKEKRFEINTRVNGETIFSKALDVAIEALNE